MKLIKGFELVSEFEKYTDKKVTRRYISQFLPRDAL